MKKVTQMVLVALMASTVTAAVLNGPWPAMQHQFTAKERKALQHERDVQLSKAQWYIEQRQIGINQEIELARTPVYRWSPLAILAYIHV